MLLVTNMIIDLQHLSEINPLNIRKTVDSEHVADFGLQFVI